jgi:hypothetical protein
MRRLADLSADLIRQLHFQGAGWVDIRTDDPMPQNQIYVDLAALQTGYVSFLKSFATNVSTLQGIAEQELAHQPLTTNREAFLKDLVEMQSIVYTNLSCVTGWITNTVVKYSGWYPTLFYVHVFDRGVSPPVALNAMPWSPMSTPMFLTRTRAIPGAFCMKGSGMWISWSLPSIMARIA